MDFEHSSLLYSALNENYTEIFDAFNSKINIVYVFDENDREVVPERFRTDGQVCFR